MIDSIVKIVRGIIKLRGASDNTLIGNTGDRLKVDPGTITAVLSPNTNAPFNARIKKIIASNQTIFSNTEISQDLNLVSLIAGGRGPFQVSLYRVDINGAESIPGGGFNSSGDVSQWTNASLGDSAAGSWSYSTAQAYEGTGSALFTFTKSDSGDAVQIRHTFLTPKDFAEWRYIGARAYVTVAGGGSTSRTLSIVLTDANGATRTFSLSGTTTTAPFNVAQWNQILGEISNPTSESGTFDVHNVVSITLRLQDGADKTGSIYWDQVQFTQSQELILEAFGSANSTVQLNFDPLEAFTDTETLGIEIKNNDSVSREFDATARGYFL